MQGRRTPTLPTYKYYTKGLRKWTRPSQKLQILWAQHEAVYVKKFNFITIIIKNNTLIKVTTTPVYLKVVKHIPNYKHGGMDPIR